ncbi:MAG TPA: hypothetical protein VKV73_14235 [Chloroflexota bacterium]|nr:hypothetical protein [Chloroflexota bacterium]
MGRVVVVVALLVGLVLGGAFGFVSGIATSTNWYEYRILGTDEVLQAVNQDGWEPMPNMKPPNQTIAVYYRRPRLRLGE